MCRACPFSCGPGPRIPSAQAASCCSQIAHTSVRTLKCLGFRWTGARGWAYHSVGGWYLATSPEHYRTYLCHIKSTKSERFTDTAQFSHKKITRPTITHTDKIMAAIVDCAKAIKNAGNSSGIDEIHQLIQLTEEVMGKSSPQHSTKHTPAAPRVQPAINNDNRPQWVISHCGYSHCELSHCGFPHCD